MAVTQRDIDKNQLSTKDYIDKYYSNVDLTDWRYWMASNIQSAWSQTSRNEFLIRWGDRMKSFDFDKMKNFYQRSDLLRFDEDVRKFIAFLAGSGFFEYYQINFNDWINSKNFTNPMKDYEQDVAIQEALNLDGGMNYIRKQLMNLHWWRR